MLFQINIFVLMKKIISILIIVTAISVLFAQDYLLESFTANSDGRNVVLDWKSSNEANVSGYEIERSSGNSDFKYIWTEKAHGYASVYSFKDDNIFMKDDVNKVQGKNNFSYRIKILKKDNSIAYSNNVNVVHSLSGIQKTWGMIKEMFR